MEIYFNLIPTTTIITFSIVLILFLWKSGNFSSTNKPKKTRAPEAGGAWPVIGHLHLLASSQPGHITLGQMADKYGPIFTIRMGLRRALVVSNWEIAKECLTTNDKAFANRPKILATKILGYNYAMIGFSPYGQYWRHMRKITTIELLSSHRLEKLRDTKETQVKSSIKELHELCVTGLKGPCKALVDMKNWFGDVTLNVIMSIIVGKVKSGEWKGALKEFFELSGRFVVSDALPFLGWFDIGGSEKAMKRIARDLEGVFKEWLEEHKRKRELSGAVKADEDFMDIMLTILDDAEDFPDYDADTINKATCLALILAASDTTTVTLTWTLSLLLNHRNVLEKAQEELDSLIGNERHVNESDISSLVYLQAIFKETMRLYPAGPLSIPHESIEDCTTAGYHIPAGTQLFVNIWKIHRDPRVWSDPSEFKPERFLTTHKDVDLRGQNFELIPFGSGRRMCPGISFALQIVQLTMAKLLHGFDIRTPLDEPVDMTEGVGMTDHKASPLEVLLTPRLPAHLYD